MINKVINRIRAVRDTSKGRSETRTVLQALSLNEDVITRELVEVFKSMLDRYNWTENEALLLKGIDRIRSGYLASRETVELMDHGAGNSNSERTEKEMHTGVLKTVNVSDVCRTASTQTVWGELIFRIIRRFKPLSILELGTCLGVSGAYQVSALSLNGKGVFNTLEGSDELARLADRNLRTINYQSYNVHVGRFSDILPTVLPGVPPIDFAFIDGHHDKVATQNYYDQIYPFLSKRAILIFDDINWSTGMDEFWTQICKKGIGIKVSFDLGKWGVCVIDKDHVGAEKRVHRITL